MSNLLSNLSVVLRPWSRVETDRDLDEIGPEIDYDALPTGPRLAGSTAGGRLADLADEPAMPKPRTGRRPVRPAPAAGPASGVRIHPLACVDPRATLGENVEVGPFCLVGPDVILGAGTVLQNHVTVTGHTTLGRDNVVYPNAVLGADPQDKKFGGEVTRLEIGDRNQIREAVTIHVGTAKGGGVTRVGSDNLLMVNVHLGHDVQWGNHTVVANNVMVAGHVHCGDHVAIMGAAGFHHFVTIGDHAFIGGAARVHHDAPPFCRIDGADEVRGVNAVGLQRHGFSGPSVEALDAAVRLLFLRKKPMSTARSEVESGPLVDDPNVRTLLDFLDRRTAGKHGRHLEGQRK